MIEGNNHFDHDDLDEMAFAMQIANDTYVIDEKELRTQFDKACEWVLSDEQDVIRRGLANLMLLDLGHPLSMPPPAVVAKIVKVAVSSTFRLKVRSSAIDCLENYGPAVSHHVPVLRVLLHDREPTLCAQAAVMLIRIDRQRADEYLAVLCSLVESMDPTKVDAVITSTIDPDQIEHATAKALFTGIQANIERLLTAASDYERLHFGILEWLAEHFPDSREFRLVLNASLRSTTTSIRDFAVETSQRIAKRRKRRTS